MGHTVHSWPISLLWAALCTSLPGWAESWPLCPWWAGSGTDESKMQPCNLQQPLYSQMTQGTAQCSKLQWSDQVQVWAGEEGTRHVSCRREDLGGLSRRQEDQMYYRWTELGPQSWKLQGKRLWFNVVQQLLQTLCLFFFFGHTPRAFAVFTPNQGLNPHSLHWKRGVLNTGPKGKLWYWGYLSRSWLSIYEGYC